MQVPYLQIRGTPKVQYLQIRSTLQVPLKSLSCKKIPQPPQNPLIAAPKVPEFCPEVNGNPEPLGDPIVCNIATIATELLLLGWELK